MTTSELYAFLDARIPSSLSCEWDNDGLMCCPDGNREVKKILIALDLTAEVVQAGIDGGFDALLSHHPLIFQPVRNLSGDDAVTKKVIALIRAGITAMSFHTRLDAVAGGVNDVLAAGLGLLDVKPFGENGEALGRIGTLPAPMPAEEFAGRVRDFTGAPTVELSPAGIPVCRVAVLGGGGADDAAAAFAAGADTYVTGELKHHQLTTAPENRMNLIAAGHFYSENPVCARLAELVAEADPSIRVTVMNSYPAKRI